MPKAITDRKRHASNTFATMFEGEDKPTPEEVVVSVMHGAGDNQVTDRQLEAAKTLLPYRLPKLAQVEAHVATEEQSHEDWIEAMYEDDEE